VPILAVFFAGRRTNKIHIVAVIPVAHPNTFGAADVPNGEVGDNIQQAFADAHDARGTNWMDATMKFVPAAHIAIVAERVVHTTILHNIVAVGEDRAERLVNGLNALEARINSTTANHVAMSRGGCPRRLTAAWWPPTRSTPITCPRQRTQLRPPQSPNEGRNASRG
jgi:hypothetical protein